MHQVLMADQAVFEVYGVAHDLGLEELCRHCQDHLAASITPHTACTFLTAALSMHHRTGGQYQYLPDSGTQQAPQNRRFVPVPS